ncbi:TIGR02530 family flagellar biosynthesis protein [Paenibacillus koleovorans]|uniref:TIGR02530 family flagellar biosynthesis protein n=1 Tax=Paenibacillus koleovorans TaxID=121608 RepID=UPI000FD6F3C9|nr:TIGR02530 family flagellar biosynthesis protein [Paenibacillus koleovorans]
MADRISVGRMFPNVAPPVANRKPLDSARPHPYPGARSFQDVLNENVVRLSQHAETRLQQRGIQLKPEQMERIQSAIDKAASKGSKDSLVLMDDIALIVNVKNRTVVTAMDGASMRDNVFTQIDSAIII